MTRHRALGAVVMAVVFAGASIGIAGASTPDARAEKKKVTKVAVVVTDMEMDHSDTDDHGHAPGSMTLVATPDTVKHGKIKFTVTNEGSEEHEFVVLKTSTPFDELAVDAKSKVNEATSVGEIGDIPAGKTRTKVFKLKKGEYVLVCNIAEHYEAGMRGAFTVT